MVENKAKFFIWLSSKPIFRLEKRRKKNVVSKPISFWKLNQRLLRPSAIYKTFSTNHEKQIDLVSIRLESKLDHYRSKKHLNDCVWMRKKNKPKRLFKFCQISFCQATKNRKKLWHSTARNWSQKKNLEKKRKRELIVEHKKNKINKGKSSRLQTQNTNIRKKCFIFYLPGISKKKTREELLFSALLLLLCALKAWAKATTTTVSTVSSYSSPAWTQTSIISSLLIRIWNIISLLSVFISPFIYAALSHQTK